MRGSLFVKLLEIPQHLKKRELLQLPKEEIYRFLDRYSYVVDHTSFQVPFFNGLIYIGFQSICFLLLKAVKLLGYKIL